MSYILDALRKSEQERAAAAPAIGAQTAPAGGRPVPKGALLAIVTLAVVLGAGIAFAWRAATAPSESDLSPLPAPAPVAAPPVATPPPALASVPTEHGPRLADQLALPARPPEMSTTATAADAPRDAPLLRQMPDDFRRSLPPLAINIHVYSTSPDQCVLYINNRQYRAGERVAPGLRLERIVEDGAILSYAGSDFKLPRPN